MGRKIIIAVEEMDDGGMQITDCAGNVRIAFSQKELGYHVRAIMKDESIPSVTEDQINPVVEGVAGVVTRVRPELGGVSQKAVPLLSELVNLARQRRE